MGVDTAWSFCKAILGGLISGSAVLSVAVIICTFDAFQPTVGLVLMK